MDHCVGARDVLKWKVLRGGLAAQAAPRADAAELQELETELRQAKARSSADHPRQRVRDLEMHIATLTNTVLPARKNIVDECLLHKCKRVVDRDNARTYCPECGESGTFQSHIFDSKASEDLSHGGAMSVVSAPQPQFAFTPANVMEQVAVGFSKIHSADPAKVTAARTAQILKSAKIPRKPHSRIASEMRAEPLRMQPKKPKK
jgi:hypothetical protein